MSFLCKLLRLSIVLLERYGSLRLRKGTAMDWLLHNKEWVFSGIGVAAISVIFGWVFKRKSPPISGDNIKQRQQGGVGSQNIQIGKIERKDK